MNVSALYTNNGSLVIHPSFRPSFVGELKSHVPKSCRQWRGYNQSWLIAPSHADVALKIFRKHFPAGEVFVPRSIGGAA